ncbi:acetyltransferase (GNAT) family protein [Jatrophihabitans sp. GAS493]|uniref:GNAT family N-acetyltransferase n=1 Tax=Jatrophihabitans sp. GAS493 TaxID=1907575 RepID=UPI000BC0DB95|nr:GNAT family N-acetyltransferase [Jatrophihabitans sp. GAS493]SOD73452.1 acetyltransferase (GNAT) family protein [Jatrophihabitans sp. GAS493]
MSRIPLRIRHAEIDDTAQISQLVKSTGLSVGAAGGRQFESDLLSQLPKRIHALLGDPDVSVLVAVDDEAGLLYGLVVLNIDQVAAVNPVPVLNVSHLLVDDSKRRRGVGRSLLVAAVHEADQRGIEHLVATAVTGSREANRYLARLGFAPLVTRRIASTQVLRRSLGLAEAPERVARLRRLRSGRVAAVKAPAQIFGRGA